MLEDLRAQVREAYDRREQELSSDLMRFLEKTFMLQVIDHHWKDHLLGMDHLRDGIGLRGYGQKDPLIEYKREGYDLFAGMMERVKSDTLDRLFHVQAVRNEGATRRSTASTRHLTSTTQRSSSIAEKNRSHLRHCSTKRRKSRPQRPLPLRQREKIQEVPRGITCCEPKRLLSPLLIRLLFHLFRRIAR